MIIVIGEKGLKFSHQNDFPKNATCICGGEGRIAFVVKELYGEENYVRELHENKGKGNLWPHDAIAVAVYLCKDCLKPIAIFNQG